VLAAVGAFAGSSESEDNDGPFASLGADDTGTIVGAALDADDADESLSSLLSTTTDVAVALRAEVDADDDDDFLAGSEVLGTG